MHPLDNFLPTAPGSSWRLSWLLALSLLLALGTAGCGNPTDDDDSAAADDDDDDDTTDDDDAAGDCSEDSYEDNDSQAEAAALSAGLNSDLRICPGDVDWFSFEQAAEGMVSLTATISDPADFAIEVAILDSSSEEVAVGETPLEGTLTLEATLEAGTWNIRVTNTTSEDNTGSGYSLEF